MLLALYGGERSHFHMLSSLERRKDYIDQAEQLLQTVGLYEKRYDSLHVLSYGDQRLVELALAYTSKPKVVLLDEPSAGLPTAEAFAFADIIRKLSSRHAACSSARTTWTSCSTSPTASWC